jgi:hypothetical protein
MQAAFSFRDPNLIAVGCTLCAAMGKEEQLAEALRGVAPQMCASIMPHLLHKHARIRISAINAVRAMVPLGAGDCIRDLAAFRESNIIVFKEFYDGATRVNYMGSLVVDTNPKVRLCFFEMLCDWLINMRDVNNYETLVMPYCLTGFSDPSPAIQKLVFDTLEELG